MPKLAKPIVEEYDAGDLVLTCKEGKIYKGFYREEYEDLIIKKPCKLYGKPGKGIVEVFDLPIVIKSKTSKKGIRINEDLTLDYL